MLTTMFDIFLKLGGLFVVFTDKSKTSKKAAVSKVKRQSKKKVKQAKQKKLWETTKKKPVL